MSAYLKESEQLVSCCVIGTQDHQKGIHRDGADHHYLKRAAHYDSLHECLALSVFPPVEKLNKRYDYLTTELDPQTMRPFL